MHVREIHLHNFMAYKDQKIELSPRLNSVVGISDSGKSTLIRALIWVFHNRPSGLEMLREPGATTHVTLVLDNGDIVKRTRSKSINSYTLNTQEFHSVKTDVPLEVQKALGVHIAEISPKNYDTLEYSRQLDGPFMISSSGPDAAKILGNLSSISTIDTGLSSLRSDILKSRQVSDIHSKHVQNYIITLKEFTSLEDEELRVHTASLRIKEAQDLELRKKRLTDILTEMKDINELQSTADSQLNTLRARLSVKDLLEQAKATDARAIKLHSIISDMKEINESSIKLVEEERRERAELACLEKEKMQALLKAGICPMCNQLVK